MEHAAYDLAGFGLCGAVRHFGWVAICRNDRGPAIFPGLVWFAPGPDSRIMGRRRMACFGSIPRSHTTRNDTPLGYSWHAAEQCRWLRLVWHRFRGRRCNRFWILVRR